MIQDPRIGKMNIVADNLCDDRTWHKLHKYFSIKDIRRMLRVANESECKLGGDGTLHPTHARRCQTFVDHNSTMGPVWLYLLYLYRWSCNTPPVVCTGYRTVVDCCLRPGPWLGRGPGVGTPALMYGVTSTCLMGLASARQGPEPSVAMEIESWWHILHRGDLVAVYVLPKCSNRNG